MIKEDNFLGIEFYLNENIDKVINNNKELEFEVLFLFYVFSLVFSDVKLDIDLSDYSIDDYYNVFENNIDKVDLNDIKYKVVFKDLIKFGIRNVKLKSKEYGK
jgi:hypothetical protein